MNKSVFDFIEFIRSKDGIGNKSRLISEAQKSLALLKIGLFIILNIFLFVLVFPHLQVFLIQ